MANVEPFTQVLSLVKNDNTHFRLIQLDTTGLYPMMRVMYKGSQDLLITYNTQQEDWKIEILRNPCAIVVKDKSHILNARFHIESLMQFKSETIRSEKKKLVSYLFKHKLHTGPRSVAQEPNDCIIRLDDSEYTLECDDNNLKWSLVYRETHYSIGVTANELLHTNLRQMMDRLWNKYIEHEWCNK
jgi:hypothetical protein